MESVAFLLRDMKFVFPFEKNLGFNKYWQNTSPLSVAENKAEHCYDAYLKLRGPSLSGVFLQGLPG